LFGVEVLRVLSGRDGRLGFWVALAAVAVLAALLLVGCDLPGPPPPAPTPTATAVPNGIEPSLTPPVGVEGTETDTISSVLTEIPNLPTPTAVPSPAGIDEAASVQIYSAVVAALLDKQSPPYVYLSPYIGQGEHLDEPDQGNPLPRGLLPALAASGTRARYEVRDFSQAIGPLDAGGQVINGGVFVTLGPIANEGASQDTVAVRASIYRKVGDAQGLVLHLRRDPSGWRVLDSKQEWTDE
jgi:hypothetical protein